MNRLIFYYLLSITLCTQFISCSSTSVKDKIKKTGDATGQAIGEFATGVTSGVKKTIEPQIEIKEDLKKKGISCGKMIIASDSVGFDNVLVAYIIFNLDFTGSITAKAFDNNNLEMGRVKLEVKGKKDDAKYFEFHFDKRTNIDNDCKLVIE